MKIEHNFFPIAASAFISYLDTIFKPFEDILPTGQKFPIAILNTGDEVFLTNKYAEGDKSSTTLYTLCPRLTMDVKGFTIDSSQLTNRNIYGEVIGKNDEDFDQKYIIPVRRIPTEWVFATEIRFNNIMEFMQFVEIYMTVSHHNHYFTFNYAGKEFSGSFFIQEDIDSNANMLLQFDSDKRKRILPLTFVLQLQFPSLDIYPRGLHGDETIPGGQTMIKLIHNLDVENCVTGVTDHITTEITENGAKII